MPRRNVSFANGEYYHIFNRTIHKEPIFVKDTDCRHAITTLSYYLNIKTPMRLSYFLSLGYEIQIDLLNKMKQTKKLVEIISYCLMPNHYHFLIRQLIEEGVSRYMSLFQNSYTKYFNTKNKREGHLFVGQFKGVHIENNEQLLHVNRYIHLNPHTGFVVRSLLELQNYPHSSFTEYLENKDGICNKEIILSQFSSSNSYKDFVLNEADYQRTRKSIEHLILE